MSKQLLLTEVYPDVRDTLSDLCGFSNYDVISAYSSQAAMEAISKEVPDIIIVDEYMPLVSSYEILNFLRQQVYGKYTTAVLLANDTLDKNAPEAQLADMVIIKPFGIVDLLSILQIRGEII